MPRSVNLEEYSKKQNEILDVAQHLVYTRGFEQFAIQDILDQLKISKGAFFHYFPSKSALLEALIERLSNQAKALVDPIVQDPHLSALEKLHRYSDAVGRWKTAQKDLMLSVLRVWYADDNAIVRLKVQSMGLKWMAPILTDIVRQGIREGTFSFPYPDQAGEVIYYMLSSLADTFAGMLLHAQPDPDAFERARQSVTVYMRALERILRAPENSLHLMDDEILREWFPPPNAGGAKRMERGKSLEISG